MCGIAAGGRLHMAYMSPSLQRGREGSSCNAKARPPETSVRSGCVTSAAVWPGSHLKYVSTDLMFTLQSCLGMLGINIYIQYSRDDGEQVSLFPCDILDPNKTIQADQLQILQMSASNIDANRWECRFEHVVNICEVNYPFSIMLLSYSKYKKMKADQILRRFRLRWLWAVCFWIVFERGATSHSTSARHLKCIFVQSTREKKVRWLNTPKAAVM